MASCIDVMLYLGWDADAGHAELHEYITATLPEDVANYQHLTLVSGSDLAADIAGSAQAGSLRAYVGLLRRGRSDLLIDYLEKAPWRGYSGILIVKPEDFDETIVEFTSKGRRVIQDGKLIY